MEGSEMTLATQVRAARTPATKLAALIARGEDSGHQFKRDITHVDGMAAALAAFANMRDGSLRIGMSDDGVVVTRLNKTRSPDAALLARRLQDSGVVLAGSILNDD